jgi:dihydrofolate reductase
VGSVTLTAFMTLDGYTETADGALITPAWSGDLQAHWSGENAREGTLLLYGRASFEFNAGLWPGAADDTSNPEEFRAFARVMNGLPKAVISNTLTEVCWNGRVLTGSLLESVRRLKADFDGEIVATGGMQLASTLLASGEVDRLRILLMPRIAGSGRSIFAATQPAQDFELITNLTMDTGAVILTYLARR